MIADRRLGMTLLELVVGLTVTGLVLSAGFGAVQVLGDRRRQADQVMSRAAQAANARAELLQWIAGARLVGDEGGPQFRGLDGVHGGIPDDELSFLTTAPTPLGAAGETVVLLYVDRDPETPEQGLTAAFGEWRGRVVQRVTIDGTIAAMDASYHSGVLGGGQRVWLPSWVSSTILPAGVRIQLSAAAGDSIAPLLSYPLVVPLGNGR